MLPPPEIRRGAGVDVAEIALALGIVQEEPLPSPGDDPSQAEGQLEVLLPPQGELEGLQGVQLLVGGEAEVHPGDAPQRLGEVLDDRANGERAEAPIARCPVPRPPGAGALGARHRRPEGEHVGHAPHDKFLGQVIEPVQVLQDEPELAHQPRVLEVLLQVRIELGDEEGIVGRQGGDEGGIDGEVVLRRMAGPAGPAVPAEFLVEEDVLPSGDELALAVGRRGRDGLAGGQSRRTQDNSPDGARQGQGAASCKRASSRCHTTPPRVGAVPPRSQEAYHPPASSRGGPGWPGACARGPRGASVHRGRRWAPQRC